MKHVYWQILPTLHIMDTVIKGTFSVVKDMTLMKVDEIPFYYLEVAEFITYNFFFLRSLDTNR